MRKFARSIGSEGKRQGPKDGTVSFRDGLYGVVVFGFVLFVWHVSIMFSFKKATSRGGSNRPPPGTPGGVGFEPCHL